MQSERGTITHPHRGIRTPQVRLIWMLLVASLWLLAACGGEEPPAETLPAGEPTVVYLAGKVAAGDAAAGNAAGNAGAGAVPSATPTPEPVRGRLVLWHSWAEADGEALAQILAGFKEAYPEVTVDTLYVGYPDLAQGYADAVRSGSGPDVVLAPSWWLGDLVEAGVVQPLDGIVGSEELQNYWPAAVDSLRQDGQLYGLPTHFELVSLFVNRSLADPATAPATTGDMLAPAQQAPTQGIGLYNSLYHLYWGIPAYGSQLFDAGGLVTLDQGGDAASYLAWLRDIGNTAGSYVDTDYGMLLDRFKKGEFAYFVDGPWSIGELTAALGDNLAVAPLPAGPAGPAQPWLSADGILLNPNIAPDQQQLAALFARYLTGPEGGAILGRVAKRLPGTRSVVVEDPLLQGFASQAATAQPMPNVPEMEQMWAYGGDMIVKVVDGNADPAATVKETAALVNDANNR